MTHHDIEQPVADDAQPTQTIGYLPSQSEEPPPPPLRPRRRKLPIATLALSLAAAAGVGFFAGVRVEKANVTPTASSSTRNGGSLAALGFGNATNAGNRAAGATPSAAPNGNPGAGGNNAAGGGAGSSANIVGTITVVQGGTLYITEASGDTVKVTTSDGTTVTKTTTGAVKDLAPGESVVIRGVQSADGVYAAQSVTQGSALAGGFGGRTGSGRGARGGGATATPTPGSGN